MPAKRVIVLDLVCLQAEHLQDESRTPNLSRLAREGWSAPLVPPFPAVTCTVQATLTTGAPPSEHGVVCNGLYERDRFAIRFWDQPTSMVTRQQVWETLRQRDPSATSALLFFQNTMFASADVVVEPGEALASTYRDAERLAAGPEQAYGVIKTMLIEARSINPFDALDREVGYQAELFDSDDFAEGIAAFHEKRSPAFGAKKGTDS